MPKTKERKPRAGARQLAQEPQGESRYFSRAVGKAIQMLELLSRSASPLSLNELTNQTQLTKSSAFRLLQTLETLHYIRRDSNGHYLSAQDKNSAVSAQYVSGVVAAAQGPMRKLNMEFGETISMSVLAYNHIEVVHVIESTSLIRMTNFVGRILPPHASSMGKAITAWQDPDTRKRLLMSYGLTRYNENTIVDEHTIEEEYERIRSRGYSTDAEETTFGGCCFGAPIFTAPSRVEAAISISMPKSRMPDEAKKQALKAAAQEISQ
jgi:DNA-binding IclR family transcriptional regulator